jgi:hypothetical protein
MQFSYASDGPNLEVMNANSETLINFSFFGRARVLHSNFGLLWCTLTHNSPKWPVKGRYQCARCLRYHPVPWDSAESNWNYASLDRIRYVGPKPKGLSRADLVRIVSRATAIEHGPVEHPTKRMQLACGHEDEVRLGIDPNQAICATCRANGVRLSRPAA